MNAVSFPVSSGPTKAPSAACGHRGRFVEHAGLREHPEQLISHSQRGGQGFEPPHVHQILPHSLSLKIVPQTRASYRGTATPGRAPSFVRSAAPSRASAPFYPETLPAAGSNCRCAPQLSPAPQRRENAQTYPRRRRRDTLLDLQRTRSMSRGYSVITLSAHSTRETKMVGLPNFAP
jgi:hypothetical protein